MSGITSLIHKKQELIPLPRFPHGFASAVFLLFLFIFAYRSPLMLNCADSGWHIAAGDLIRAEKRIPVQDPWSFTAGDYDWIDLSWLWDIWMSFLHQQSQGFYLPIVFTIILNALALGILAGTSVRRGASILAAYLSILFGGITFSFGLAVRPHQVTNLAALFSAVLLQLYWQQRKPRYLVYLVVLVLFWANLHGGFIVGLAMAAIYSCFSLLEQDRRRFIPLSVCTISCVVASLINPFGWRIYEGVGRTLQGPLRVIISEWQPLAFTYQFRFHLVYVLALAAAFPLLFFNRRVNRPEIAIAFGAGLLTLSSERSMSLLVAVSLPLLALAVDQACARLPQSVSKLWTRKNLAFGTDFERPVVRQALFGAAVLAIVLLFLGAGRPMLTYKPPEQRYSIREIGYLVSRHSDKNCLNYYFDGGYFIYFARGRPKLFIDGRAETAYSPEVVRSYLSFYFMEPGWESMLSNYKVSCVIMPRQSVWDDYFRHRPDWKVDLEGPVATVFVRSER
jgi:hypothetical protein